MRFSLFFPMAAYDDPVDVNALYTDAVDMAVAAEAAGAHAIYFNEGHVFQHNFRSPNPRLIAAAAIARTRTLRVGTGLVLLPYHDPRLVAEDAIMLDALSNGRFVFGVGPGFQRDEITQFSMDPDERRAAFDAKFAALNAFLDGETVTQNDQYVRATDAVVGVRPRADFVDRRYRGAVSREGAMAIGASGWGLMLSPLERRSEFETRDGVDFVRECCALHALGWAQSVNAERERPPVLMQVYAAAGPSKAEVRRTAGPAFERFQREVCRREPKGELAYFDEYAANSASMIGDYDTLRARVRALAEAGVGEILLMMNYGGRDRADVLSDLARFTTLTPDERANAEAAA